jgi:S1-C subfamily serine protease
MSSDPRYTPWAEPVRRRPAPTSLFWPVLVLLVAVGLVVGGLFLVRGLVSWTKRGVDPDAQPRPVTARGALTEIEQTNIRVYKQNRPSVVHITTLVSQSSFMGANQVPSGTGSGFIWDDEGHVVTNYHVIQNANAARVTLSDQTSYRAWYVGGAPEKDLAVLSIEAPKSKLRPVLIGSSADLEVGQLVFAIGNPYGLRLTMTTGIVSALDREIESVVKGQRIKDVIQHSAPINPGNSGGPLLDSSGRLIGVNTAIYSTSGASAGIGFAIPVDEVNRVVPELIRKGQTTKPERKSRPGLGVQVASDQLARKIGVESGVVIAHVLPGTPADQVGLVPARQTEDRRVILGDVIVAIDGKAIDKVADLFEVLKGYKAGNTVSVEILRDGKRITKSMTLAPLD